MLAVVVREAAERGYDAIETCVGAAEALAVHATEVFGKAMIKAWDHPSKTSTADVLSLVDEFISYPTAYPSCWRPTLKAYLMTHKPK